MRVFGSARMRASASAMLALRSPRLEPRPMKTPWGMPRLDPPPSQPEPLDTRHGFGQAIAVDGEAEPHVALAARTEPRARRDHHAGLFENLGGEIRRAVALRSLHP